MAPKSDLSLSSGIAPVLNLSPAALELVREIAEEDPKGKVSQWPQVLLVVKTSPHRGLSVVVDNSSGQAPPEPLVPVGLDLSIVPEPSTFFDLERLAVLEERVAQTRMGTVEMVIEDFEEIKSALVGAYTKHLRETGEQRDVNIEALLVGLYLQVHIDHAMELGNEGIESLEGPVNGRRQSIGSMSFEQSVEFLSQPREDGVPGFDLDDKLCFISEMIKELSAFLDTDFLSQEDLAKKINTDAEAKVLWAIRNGASDEGTMRIAAAQGPDKLLEKIIGTINAADILTAARTQYITSEIHKTITEIAQSDIESDEKTKGAKEYYLVSLLEKARQWNVVIDPDFLETAEIIEKRIKQEEKVRGNKTRAMDNFYAQIEVGKNNAMKNANNGVLALEAFRKDVKTAEAGLQQEGVVLDEHQGASVEQQCTDIGFEILQKCLNGIENKLEHAVFLSGVKKIDHVELALDGLEEKSGINTIKIRSMIAQKKVEWMSSLFKSGADLGTESDVWNTLESVTKTVEQTGRSDIIELWEKESLEIVRHCVAALKNQESEKDWDAKLGDLEKVQLMAERSKKNFVQRFLEDSVDPERWKSLTKNLRQAASWCTEQAKTQAAQALTISRLVMDNTGKGIASVMASVDNQQDTFWSGVESFFSNQAYGIRTERFEKNIVVKIADAVKYLQSLWRS